MTRLKSARIDSIKLDTLIATVPTRITLASPSLPELPPSSLLYEYGRQQGRKLSEETQRAKGGKVNSRPWKRSDLGFGSIPEV